MKKNINNNNLWKDNFKICQEEFKDSELNSLLNSSENKKMEELLSKIL